MTTPPRHPPPAKATASEAVQPAIRDPDQDPDPIIFYDPAALSSVREFFGAAASPPYIQIQHEPLFGDFYYEGRGTYDPQVDDMAAWRQRNESQSNSAIQPVNNTSGSYEKIEGRRAADRTSGLDCSR